MFPRFPFQRNDLGGNDPFSTLGREIGRVVEEVARGFPPLRGGVVGAFQPDLDLRETPQGLELTAELPGLSEDQLDLQLEGEVLTLRGEKKEEKSTEEHGVFLQERSYGRFQRSLRLPFAPDPAKVEARFERGVLAVTLPRPQPQGGSGSRIPIRGAGG